MEPIQLPGRLARWMLLVGAALFVSLWIVLAGARPALASCTTSSGPCTAVVSLTDARVDRVTVPFSGASTSDATADSPMSIERLWNFAIVSLPSNLDFAAETLSGISRRHTTPPIRTSLPAPCSFPPFWITDSQTAIGNTIFSAEKNLTKRGGVPVAIPRPE